MRFETYLTETEDNPYGFQKWTGPKREGNSKKAWKEFIITQIRYNEWRYGKTAPDNWAWYGSLGENITKIGLDALRELEKEGVVEMEINDRHITGLPIKGPGGKLKGWGGSKSMVDFRAKKGRNFPK